MAIVYRVASSCESYRREALRAGPKRYNFERAIVVAEHKSSENGELIRRRTKVEGKILCKNCLGYVVGILLYHAPEEMEASAEGSWK